MKSIPDIKELRRICQPADLDICLYRRMVTRRVSIFLTSPLLHMGVTANTISVIKGLLACAGASMFAFGSSCMLVIGAFLLQLSFILDAVDGEIARFTGSNVTAGGEYLDKLGDAASRSLFYAAWGWGVYRVSGQASTAVAGAIMGGLWLVVRFCSVETLLESLSAHKDSPANSEEQESMERLFVREPSQGRTEYLLSLVFHPWVNLATAAAAASFLPHAFMVFFWIWVVLWMVNTTRKVYTGFKITDFKRFHS